MPAWVAAARDCEAYGESWLGQPANTVSSFAFFLVGAWLLWRAARGDGRLIWFGLSALAIGAGSVAFHGPHPSWGQWAHDASIAWALALAVAFGLRALRPVPWGWLAACALLGVLLWFWPGSQRVVFGALGVSFGWLELAAVRRGSRPGRGDRGFAMWVFVLVVSAVGAFAFFLGRTAWGCEPSSVLQPHALWHLSLAAAAAGWVTVAVDDLRAGRDGRAIS